MELQKITKLAKNSQVSKATVSVDQQYLTFLLGDEVYGVEILAVKEIIAYGSLTEIPLVHPSIEGVINLRGNVVPVINMHLRFDQQPSPITKLTCVIVVEVKEEEEGDSQEMGIVVDAVDEVVNIRDEDIDSVPAFGVSIPQEYIIGMGKFEDNFVMLLSLNKILDVNELASLEHNFAGKKKQRAKLLIGAGTARAKSQTENEGDSNE